jgi:hypothetical protein
MTKNTSPKLLAKILERLTFEEFKKMTFDWIRSGHMMWYAYGNIRSDTCVSIVGRVRSLLGLKLVSKHELGNGRCVDLTEGRHKIEFDLPQKAD